MPSRTTALEFWTPRSAAAHPWLRAVVTTRRGGQSASPFASLNLGQATGDAPDRVEANRARVRGALGVTAGDLHLLHQVHGADVYEVPGARPAEGDGLRTAEPGPVLAVGVADCVPAFLWCARTRRIALVHAGWRGTAAGIVAAAIRGLVASGSHGADLHLALGPCIGPCCYEVSADVAARFPATALRREPGRIRLDLRRANRVQAEELGVPPRHIEADPPCTACNPEEYFSHRGEAGRTGRMWALCWMV